MWHKVAMGLRLMHDEDSIIEQSAVQKLLWNLLPMLCLLAMANVLDRLDLSYAAPAMDPALQLTAAELSHAENAFTLGYMLAALPAAALMLLVGARRWICGIVVAWGVISMAHAVIWSDDSLYALRFLLGVAEANLMPAMVFYLAEWMPARYRALPIACMVAAASLVPLLGEQGSNVLLHLPQWFGITDWRWLFLVEGVPAVWLGIHVLDVLPQTPPNASWLPHPERVWLMNHLHGEERLLTVGHFMDGLRKRSNWKLAGVRTVIGMAVGSLGLWLPLGMRQMGYLPPSAGATIMAVASVVGALAAVVPGMPGFTRAWLRRSLAICLVAAGLALAGAATVSSATLAVLLLALVAAICPAILSLTWVLAPYLLAGAAAAAGFAVLGMAGSLGGYLAGVLGVLRHDASSRCVILAVACFVAAWLARAMDGGQVSGAAVSTQPGGMTAAGRDH